MCALQQPGAGGACQQLFPLDIGTMAENEHTHLNRVSMDIGGTPHAATHLVEGVNSHSNEEQSAFASVMMLPARMMTDQMATPQAAHQGPEVGAPLESLSGAGEISHQVIEGTPGSVVHAETAPPRFTGVPADVLERSTRRLNFLDAKREAQKALALQLEHRRGQGCKPTCCASSCQAGSPNLDTHSSTNVISSSTGAICCCVPGACPVHVVVQSLYTWACITERVIIRVTRA